MSRHLLTYVHVSDDSGTSFAFGPDDKVPAWAADKIGAHAWAPTAKSDDDSDGPPPKAGAGSGKDVWASYAQAQDVEVPADAGRDEIIAACEADGVPVD